MNEQVKWTNLSVEAIKQWLKEGRITVSRNSVRKLLKKHDYKAMANDHSRQQLLRGTT